jgi:hypothetical protein
MYIGSQTGRLEQVVECVGSIFAGCTVWLPAEASKHKFETEKQRQVELLQICLVRALLLSLPLLLEHINLLLHRFSKPLSLGQKI